MGHSFHRKIAVLILLLALTSLVIHLRPSSSGVKKEVPLVQALSTIGAWTPGDPAPLTPKMVSALKLDDYVNQDYSNKDDSVFLYIGYYLTAKKLGALHDPLVCFPGQGWVVSDRQKEKVVLAGDPPRSVSYSIMTVQRGTDKQLILYWFQSYDETSPDTLSQKIRALWENFVTQREDNAFVRISTNVGTKSISEARQTSLGFVRDFYPVFLGYVKQGS